MITLSGNVEHVLKQVQGLKAEIPQAVARALTWEKWIERAGEVAEATLNGLAGPEEQPFVRPFVEAIQGGAIGGGFALRLASPLPRLRDVLGEARAAMAASGSFNDTMMSLFRGSITDLEEALLEWVETEKNKDERDLGKTDEEIAHLISYILISPTLGDAGRTAREGLMRHIVPWLQRQQEETAGLPPETVDLWLRSVLGAWRLMIRNEVTLRIRAELKSKKFP